MEEQWDYLIILDACRYDAFKKINDIPGELEKRISRASSTQEWLRKNFKGNHADTIYVSGNPFVSKIIKGFNIVKNFWKVEKVWKDGWNEKLGTTPPEEVTKIALKIDEKHPEKRKIIHYLQPHRPFIGKTKLILKGNTKIPWKSPKVKKAWIDNLKLVLGEVKKLIKKLDGKIIITADHGECFGRFIWGHPYGIYLKELVEVPWFTVNSGELKKE